MCQRVQDGEREPEGSAHARLDTELEVRYWRVPGQVEPPAPAEDGAPHWWHGDEDASQAFLAAQGVAL